MGNSQSPCPPCTLTDCAPLKNRTCENVVDEWKKDNLKVVEDTAIQKWKTNNLKITNVEAVDAWKATRLEEIVHQAVEKAVDDWKAKNRDRVTYKDVAHYHGGRVGSKQEAVAFCASKGLELCSTEALKSHNLCDYQWVSDKDDGAYFTMRSINQWRAAFNNTDQRGEKTCEFVGVGDQPKNACKNLEWWNWCGNGVPGEMQGPHNGRSEYAFSCCGDVEQTSQIHWHASDANERRAYSNFQLMCENQGKRLCTHTELCPNGNDSNTFANASLQGITVKDSTEFAGDQPLNTDLWVAIEISNQYSNKWVQAGNRAGGNCSPLSYYHASSNKFCPWCESDQRGHHKRLSACCDYREVDIVAPKEKVNRCYDADQLSEAECRAWAKNKGLDVTETDQYNPKGFVSYGIPLGYSVDDPEKPTKVWWARDLHWSGQTNEAGIFPTDKTKGSCQYKNTKTGDVWFKTPGKSVGHQQTEDQCSALCHWNKRSTQYPVNGVKTEMGCVLAEQDAAMCKTTCDNDPSCKAVAVGAYLNDENKRSCCYFSSWTGESPNEYYHFHQKNSGWSSTWSDDGKEGWCVCQNCSGNDREGNPITKDTMMHTIPGAANPASYAGQGSTWTSICAAGKESRRVVKPQKKSNCSLLYCNAHEDLKTAFCGGQQCNTLAQAEACYDHWLEYGIPESRTPNLDECMQTTTTTYTCLNGIDTPVRLTEGGDAVCPTSDAPACYVKYGEKDEEATTKQTCESKGHTWGGQNCAWGHCKRAGPEQGTVRIAYPDGGELVCTEENYANPDHWCTIAREKLSRGSNTEKRLEYGRLKPDETHSHGK